MPKRNTNIVTVEVNTQYRVWQACDEEAARPVLTGVYVDPKGYLVAFSGFILAVIPAKIKGPRTFQGAIIPGSALKSTHKAIGKSADIMLLTLDMDRLQATIPMNVSQGVLASIVILTVELSCTSRPIGKCKGVHHAGITHSEITISIANQ